MELRQVSALVAGRTRDTRALWGGGDPHRVKPALGLPATFRKLTARDYVGSSTPEGAIL
jgi:hypothetical protein